MALYSCAFSTASAQRRARSSARTRSSPGSDAASPRPHDKPQSLPVRLDRDQQQRLHALIPEKAKGLRFACPEFRRFRNDLWTAFMEHTSDSRPGIYKDRLLRNALAKSVFAES